MRSFFTTLCLLLMISPLMSQENTLINGNPIAEIFADFHYYSDIDTSTITGFGLTRAYLGYNFQPGGNFYATLILNVGSPSELAYGAKERRYTFFREGSVTWKNSDLILSFGMTTTRATIYQQRWLGKRYIADNFESINCFATISDLGFSADYKINDLLKADFTLMNGEGYNELHIDKSLKTSLGLNITPTEKMLIRLYGDLDRPDGIWQHTLIGFIGFKNERITAGAETAHKSNLDKIPGNNAWGMSGTCNVRMLKKASVFGRYDLMVFEAAPAPWDYQFAVVGVEYIFNDFLKLAIDYQGTFSYLRPDSHGIFVNAHFRLWETVD